MTFAALSRAQQRCLDIDLFARSAVAHTAFEYREALFQHILAALVEQEGHALTPAEIEMVKLAVLNLWRDYADDHGLDRRAIAGPLPRPFNDVCEIPEIARTDGRVAVLARDTTPAPSTAASVLFPGIDA